MPGALAEGRRVYNEYCYFCHGYNGDGRTVAARFLDPPPRAFVELGPGDIGREEMIAAVAQGRAGTAMKAHAGILEPGEIEAVVDFVRDMFIERKAVNTWYHIPENGWFDHDRYRDAFPFALGDIPLDAPDDGLTAAELRGKRLFMTSCITCHDRGRLNDDRTLWAPRAVSWPRAGYSHRTGPAVDADSGATPYARHDTPPHLGEASERERRGEAIFQENCAFCHAADGTGRNWIGSFLEPAPRDLTDAAATAGLTPDRLRAAIADGIEGTPMSAWRHVLDEADIDAVAAYVERVFLVRDRDD